MDGRLYFLQKNGEAEFVSMEATLPENEGLLPTVRTCFESLLFDDKEKAESFLKERDKDNLFFIKDVDPLGMIRGIQGALIESKEIAKRDIINLVQKYNGGSSNDNSNERACNNCVHCDSSKVE